ncbi:MAG: alpha/beta hydrolase [Rhodothermaceae bacterium]|nr:alpha/beta hydrolase [Rhodothermaceae bacterium]
MKSIVTLPFLVQVLLIVTFLGIESPSMAQASQNTGSADAPSQLPRLQDWFLSTGDWQQDSQLYIREVGQGSETIVMLHGGWGGEHGGFVPAVEHLKNDYHFVFYDQRGSLRSPSPDSLITFDRHVEDLELLRKELNKEKITIVGHSMGTILASAYAMKYPHRIKQLVLLAPASLKNPLPEEDVDLQNKQYQAFEAFMNRPEVMQEFAKYTLNQTDHPLTSRQETSKFRINFARRMLFDVSNWSQLTGGRAMYKGHVFNLTANTYPENGWDYIQEFKGRTYPVGIIIGDHDFLDFGHQLIERWVKEVPRIKLSVIKNAGHIIWLDQPLEFAHALREHLEM